MLRALIGDEIQDQNIIMGTTFRKEYFHPTSLGYQEIPSEDKTISTQVLRLQTLESLRIVGQDRCLFLCVLSHVTIFFIQIKGSMTKGVRVHVRRRAIILMDRLEGNYLEVLRVWRENNSEMNLKFMKRCIIICNQCRNMTFNKLEVEFGEAKEVIFTRLLMMNHLAL